MLNSCKCSRVLSQSCANPSGALQLAAAIAACSAASCVRSNQLAAEHVLSAGSAAAGVRALPAVLPLLLSGTAWQHSGTVALLLQRLAAVLQPDQVLQQSLLAVRSWLPPDMWPSLAALLL